MSEEENRKSFGPISDGPISDEDSKIASDLGLDIFLNLRNKYPDDTVKDLDIILNSLCAALILLIKNRVEESYHLDMVQLINKILIHNVK